MKLFPAAYILLMGLMLNHCSLWLPSNTKRDHDLVSTQISYDSYYIKPEKSSSLLKCQKHETLNNWYILFGSIAMDRETDKSRFRDSATQVWKIQEYKNWIDYLISVGMGTFTSITRSSVDIEKCVWLKRGPVEQEKPIQENRQKEQIDSENKDEEADLKSDPTLRKNEDDSGADIKKENNKKTEPGNKKAPENEADQDVKTNPTDSVKKPENTNEK